MLGTSVSPMGGGRGGDGEQRVRPRRASPSSPAVWGLMSSSRLLGLSPASAIAGVTDAEEVDGVGDENAADGDDDDASPERRVTVENDDGDITKALPNKLTDDPERARRRLWERRSRQRRKANLVQMQAKVAALECAVQSLGLVAQENALAELLLDEDSTRMIRYLRASQRLIDEARRLTAERATLSRLIRDHERAVGSIRDVLRQQRQDDARESESETWSAQALRWRALTRAHFVPWTEAAALEAIDDALKRIQRFTLSEDLVSSGMSFFGWRDRRRIDEATQSVQFSFYKDYRGPDAEYVARRYWDMHQDGKWYGRVMLGPNVQLYYEVLQVVNADIRIVRCVEQYPGLAFKMHQLFLLFRLRSNDGFLVGVKTIPAPEVQAATDDPDAYWTSNFHWTTFDILARDSEGRCSEYRSAVNGSLQSENLKYVQRWMSEALLTIVRSESLLMGRQLLQF